MERCGGRRPAAWTVGLLVVLGSVLPAGAAQADDDGGPPGPVAQAHNGGGTPAPVDDDGDRSSPAAALDPAGPAPVTVVALTTGDGEPTELALDGAPAGGALLTEPLDVPEFYVAAVTWEGELDGEVALRVRSAGSWSGWTPLEADSDSGAGGSGTVSGTEPYIVGGGTGVQVRVTGGAALPAELGLHLVPAEPEEDEDVVETAAEVTALTTARSSAPDVASRSTALAAGPGRQATSTGLSVITRAGWRADESLMDWDPHLHELRAAVVHHTAGTNSYTAADSPRIVRGIYHYHAVTRGWGDIGYNFLVDKYGQVFEGRSGSLAAPYGLMPEAAHARGFNHGSLGISVLGDYTRLRAPDGVLDTMADVIAWKFSDAGIDVRTPSGMVSPGTYARPAGRQLARVFAHRDVGDTTCPGNNIYARIPQLLDDVAERVERLGERPSTFHLRNTAAPGSADRSVSVGQAADTVLMGDWDGDGTDTPALRRGNTYRFLDAFGGDARTVDYGRAGDTVLVGDWDGDGTDTLAVRRGKKYFVKNSISGGHADTTFIYGRAPDRVLVGDWDGDGTDTLAVRRGKEYFLKNSLRGGNADVELSYGREEDLVLVGDWDGNGIDTLTVRRGKTYFRSDSLADGPADLEFGYGRPGDAAFVGDWDGSGADGIAVRRLG